MPKTDEDKGMCEHTEVIGGTEMICILPYHGREFNNNGERQPLHNSRGGYRKWARHWFKRRYPYGGSTH